VADAPAKDGWMSERMRAPGSRHDRRRLPAFIAVVVLVAGVVAAGLLVDRRGEADADALAAPLDAEDLAPVAPASDSLGSTWYCAGGTAREGGSADHRVVIVNPGDADLTATLTAFGGGLAGDANAPDIEPVSEQVQLPARTRVAVRLADVIQAQFGAALVEVSGGEVVVEHVVRGEDDVDAAPCATASSPTWHVAGGQTTRDARERLVLFNPFADDAVVDISFTTAEGVREPDAFRGFVVPARRVVAVDVGTAVQRHPQVSLTVQARSGRLVVDRIQSFDGSAGVTGLGLTPAAPAAAAVWHFPDGFKTDGLREVVTVYNPSDAQAEVDVEVVVDPSNDPSIITAVDPFQLSIAPRRFAQIAISDEERVPAGLGHAVTVRSQNGIPVVAERAISSGDPAPRTGYAATLGSPVETSRWLTAVGGTGEGEAEFLIVLNPSLDSIARVSVATPTPGQLLAIGGVQELEVQPGARLRIDLGEHINRETLPLVITSTRPVVVERGTYPVVGGLGQSIGVAGAGAVISTVDAGAASAAPVSGG
jgi:hypothetical protein